MATYTPTGAVGVFPSDEVVEEAIERFSAAAPTDLLPTRQTCAAGDATCGSGEPASSRPAGESLQKMFDAVSATAAMAQAAGTQLASPRSQWSLLVAFVTAVVVYVFTKVSVPCITSLMLSVL